MGSQLMVKSTILYVPLSQKDKELVKMIIKEIE